MEMVEGETLKDPLPLETALDYAHQIADTGRRLQTLRIFVKLLPHRLLPKG